MAAIAATGTATSTASQEQEFGNTAVAAGSSLGKYISSLYCIVNVVQMY